MLLLLSFCGCSSVSYVIKQGFLQGGILLKRKPVDDVLKDENTPQRVKDKLSFIRDVKQFAVKELGIKPSSNYDTYVKLDRKCLVHTLTASKDDELKPHVWDFPIVGSFPYLGFF